MAYAQNPYDAYDQANQTTSYKNQVVMLYCAAIGYVEQAKSSIIEQDHDKRYQLIDKTLSIVRGLRLSLDFSANEEVANSLNNYYSDIEELLVAVQCDHKLETCDQIIENLKRIKDVWESL